MLGLSDVLPTRTRYSRVSEPSLWLEAQGKGFVGAIVASISDGRDRVLLAWPSRPDNGFVAAALALREVRARTLFARGTLALWPWRAGATYGARSILVRAEDIIQRARIEFQEIEHRRAASAGFAHESLCLVELRLNDLVPRLHGPLSASGNFRGPRMEIPSLRNPSLLETTAVFEPSESQDSPPYQRDANQILKRSGRHVRLASISAHVARVGDPLITPLALMALPTDPGELARCLAHRRFTTHGLDAVIVDLTRTARVALSADWQRQLRALLETLDGTSLPHRIPVVVLSEDTFTMHAAYRILAQQKTEARAGRRRPLEQGALLLSAGLLESPGTPEPARLAPVEFSVDVKDATLAPLRDRLLSLARRLRESGHSREVIAVRKVLRALSRFASLPLGIAEAKANASILFDGDGLDDVQLRARFFPTSALQPMAEIGGGAPEFAFESGQLLDEVQSRVRAWEQSTPVSLKLSHLLSSGEWNARDVLLVFPDAATVDVFVVSDQGIECESEVIDVSHFAEMLTQPRWRRVVLVRPEPKTIRVVVAARDVAGRVLLLGDAAGILLVQAEIGPLRRLPEFALFSERAEALAVALAKGGATHTVDLAAAELRFHALSEEIVDFTQSGDGYKGQIVRFDLEGGSRAAYRPGGGVLVFTPDDVRPFKTVLARDVQIGDDVLVLHRSLRERLSEALSRSRKTLAQLRVYHERVAAFRGSLPGHTYSAKARHVLERMRAIDPSVGSHEVPNIIRWLKVEPSDRAQQPRAARDQRRFLLFMEAAGVDGNLAVTFWNVAIVPVRSYNAREGHRFNLHIVEFVMDPEGMAAGLGFRPDGDLWQAIIDSVDRVVGKEIYDE